MKGKHATIWLKEDVVEAWDALENKSEYVNESLREDFELDEPKE